MTSKKDWLDYLARWETVEAYQREEMRSASFDLRWKQLNSAFGLAKGLGWIKPDPTEIEVFQRWAKIKEKATNPPPKA